jgi:hypothetical protein
MSHFTTLQTQMHDAALLRQALLDLGFTEVEVHAQAQGLYGYQGDLRPETAEVIVRRAQVGRASNDIGFRRDAAGRFQAVISEFDRARYDDAWLGRLNQRYAYHAARQQLEAQGFAVSEETSEVGGEIRLVLRRVG